MALIAAASGACACTREYCMRAQGRMQGKGRQQRHICSRPQDASSSPRLNLQTHMIASRCRTLPGSRGRSAGWWPNPSIAICSTSRFSAILWAASSCASPSAFFWIATQVQPSTLNLQSSNPKPNPSPQPPNQSTMQKETRECMQCIETIMYCYSNKQYIYC